MPAEAYRSRAPTGGTGDEKRRVKQLECAPPFDEAALGRHTCSRGSPKKEGNVAQSPGHRKWPEHQVRETHVEGTVRVERNGRLLAESTDVIRVDEDGHLYLFLWPYSWPFR